MCVCRANRAVRAGTRTAVGNYCLLMNFMELLAALPPPSVSANVCVPSTAHAHALLCERSHARTPKRRLKNRHERRHAERARSRFARSRDDEPSSRRRKWCACIRRTDVCVCGVVYSTHNAHLNGDEPNVCVCALAMRTRAARPRPRPAKPLRRDVHSKKMRHRRNSLAACALSWNFVP